MAVSTQPEVWLRGALPDVPPLPQPVAHALLQAQEEISALMEDFPEDRLWKKPGGMASPGFHLQHLTGVLDRLFTYAQSLGLSEQQLDYLRNEGAPHPERSSVASLVEAFEKQVDRSVTFLQQVDQAMLTESRRVGRAGLPSTVIGLLFHAAEHTMRHTGQLLLTVKWLADKERR